MQPAVPPHGSSRLLHLPPVGTVALGGRVPQDPASRFCHTFPISARNNPRPSHVRSGTRDEQGQTPGKDSKADLPLMKMTEFRHDGKRPGAAKCVEPPIRKCERMPRTMAAHIVFLRMRQSAFAAIILQGRAGLRGVYAPLPGREAATTSLDLNPIFDRAAIPIRRLTEIAGPIRIRICTVSIHCSRSVMRSGDGFSFRRRLDEAAAEQSCRITPVEFVDHYCRSNCGDRQQNQQGEHAP